MIGYYMIVLFLLLLTSTCKKRSEVFHQIYVANSLTKVLQSSEPGEQPLSSGPARIMACRNERESFQVVIEVGKQGLSGVRIEVVDLKHEDGHSVIPMERISTNPVGYVETQKPVYEVTRTGWWPDPLMPEKPVDVAADHRQPFWITIHVPDNAIAGKYLGQVQILSRGKIIGKMPMELRVWDFQLGITPPLASAVAIMPYQLSKFYGENTVNDATLRNYWDMLFSHRLSSDNLGTAIEGGINEVINGRLKGPYNFENFDHKLEYCISRGLTAYQAARLPGFHHDGPDLTREQQDRIVSYLSDLAAHLEEKKWREKAFVMVWDEPAKEKSNPVLKELQTIQRAQPALRTRLDGPVLGPVVEKCESAVDIWGLHMKEVAEGGARAEANIQRWRQEGRALWMYVACDVHHPYPNIFIEYPLIDCRILPWLTWKYDIEGLLYWGANYWGEDNLKGDNINEKWPHRNWVSANFKEDRREGINYYNGDGHLIYPGPNGTALSSIRLEALRDGMEDFEYLWLLEKGTELLEKKGIEPVLASEARNWLEKQKIAQSFTIWCHDPHTLISQRKTLAEMIVRVTACL